MKKMVLLFLILAFLLMGSPVYTYAENQTGNVNAAASSVAVQTTSLSVYPYEELDTENPWDNLCRVTVTFRDVNMGLVYEYYGDTVNYFIKSNQDFLIGWVDKNDNDEFENGEELNSAAMNSKDGFYITGARLRRGSMVNFYIGSRLPGDYEVQVFTDNNGRPGTYIGMAKFTVERGQSSVILRALNEKGTATLGGARGSASDPYKLTAGEDVTLSTSAKISNAPLKNKTVTFKQSVNLSPYTIIGTEATDDDGIALLRYEAREAGLSSYRAVVDGMESGEVYVLYSPGIEENVKAKTNEGKVLTQNEEYEIEFYVQDYLGNNIDSKGVLNVEFQVVRAPERSMFDGYSSYGSSNEDGIAAFKFKPDRIGTYSIRCKLLSKRGSAIIDVESIAFEKAAAMQFCLMKGDQAIPAVKYTDLNNDGIAEDGGYLQVKLIDASGAVNTVKRYSANNLRFTSAKEEVVEVDYDGDIRVLDKNYRGTVPITVYDNTSKISAVYNLKIVGPPAAIKPVVQSTDRKAQITLQYIDAIGNETFLTPGEEFNIVLSQSGASAWDIEPFDSTGKAFFKINADEMKSYDLAVTALSSNINKKFQIEFKPVPPEKVIIGSKNVIMFIGNKAYSQDGEIKVVDVAPFVKEGRTFVAVRSVADALGAAIGWDEATKTVTLTRSDRTVTIVIGSGSVIVQEEAATSTVIADVPAFIQDGRTVLPFRAVGEAFGAAVNYDPTARAVSYTQ